MKQKQEKAMKRHLSGLIAVFLAAAVFLSLPLAAYADPGISNTILSPAAGPSSYVASGKNLFFSAYNARNIEQPNAGDYYTAPFSMYINAPKKHSVYIYDSWEARDVNNIGTTYHGGRVTVLAEHGESSCILFYTSKYELKTAWVYTGYLVSWYPGNTQSLGWKSYRNTYNVGDPDLKWSKESFVGTRTKFTILESPIPNCVNFTLDYQVTSRNGATTAAVVGPRDVYVNDGSGWTYVGSFEYKETTACHIDITLDKAMTLAAVATIANCSEPDTFLYRQSVLDVLCI